ncbi:hypothetical protein EMPS_01944 [Entomortierella parvispora]|uniref:Uncharacterized protein n=1 Tax=Entomortierella parvispora TaxID=205924 RepID=A0A9P3H3X4_9FUNG|nr:hypothetical protein EMPS_01944 [Entomortierella parvispora]
MAMDPQSDPPPESIGAIAPELATPTSTPSLSSMPFPPQHFSESSLSSSSSSSTSASIPQLLQSVSPTEEASAAQPPQISLSANSSVSSFSSSPPPDRPPPPPPRPLFSSVAFLALASPSSPIPQPNPSIDTTVSPSFPSAPASQPTTPVSLISSATVSKGFSPVEESQTVSSSFSVSIPSFPFKSRRTRQTKLPTPQTLSPVVPAAPSSTEESTSAPTRKRTFLAFRVRKKKAAKQADLPPATPTRTRLSLHAPSNSHSPLPSHLHSSIPSHSQPHSPKTRGPTSPSTQIVTQSSISHFSANSFKTSIRSHTTNLFSFKRFRRAPRPSFSSEKDPRTDRYHFPVDQQQQQQHHQQQQQQPPQQRRKISLRDPKRPTVDQDVEMQKVEYMSELYSGSMTSFDMAPGAARGGGGEEEEEVYATSTSAPSPHLQTMSSKRLRPPLAEISIAQVHPLSPSPASTTMSTIEDVSCSNGGGTIYNRPALILHNSNSYPSNGGHIAHAVDNTKNHNFIPTSNGGNGNVHTSYSFNATPAGASSAAVSTPLPGLLVNNIKNKNNKSSDNNGSIHYSIDTCNTINTYNSNSNNSNTTTPANNIQLNSNTERVRLAASAESEAEDHVSSAHHSSARSIAGSTPRQGRKRTAPRVQLSKDAKHIKMRIRKLWQDPRLPEHHQERRDPKNQYILLEEALTGILQIVPPIIQNARSSSSHPIGPSALPPSVHPVQLSDVMEVVEDQKPSSISYAPSVAQATEASALTTPLSLASLSSIGPGAIRPHSGSAIQGGSGSTPTTPIRHSHTRARTTSANSTSTISATRYQIATNMLQPPEPELTDVTQSAIRPMTNMAGASLLGEPSLITIMASAAAASSSSSNAVGGMSSGGAFPASASTVDSLNLTDHRHHVWDSNEILIAKLSSLCNTLKSAIRTLCEQQNEKVLRFDDFMIMSLLKRWEQDAAAAAEAGKDEDDNDSNVATSAAMAGAAETGRLGNLPNKGSTTSLVSLGATNALENYQQLVARVWEETDVILACIRKIRDLVEFGRVHHYSDFDDDDSEEDAVEKDEMARKGLYSTLFAHAERLVTTLGEFLECASGILRLVGTIKKHQRASLKGEKRPHERDQLPAATSPPSASPSSSSSSSPAVGPYSGLFLSSPANQPSSMAGFMGEEPRPIKHLDPALTRKLKRKTPRLKAITDKVRKKVSDLKKKSTNSILTIFPPLGDGTNDGFHWDSYSDGDYESEEWIASEMASSNWGLGTGDSGGGQDYGRLQPTPPVSPEMRTEGAGYFHGGASPPPQQQQKQKKHRRVGSKDSLSSPSAGRGDQYWPGSTPIVEGGSSVALAEEGFSSAVRNLTPTSAFSLTPPPGLGSRPSLLRTGSQDMPMSRSMSSDKRVETLGAGSSTAAPPVALGAAGDTSSMSFAAKQSLDSVREVPLPAPVPRSSVYLASSLPDYSQPLRPPPKATTDGGEKRQSFLFRRRSSQTPAFTGTSISSPIPVTSRPFSVHSSGSETQSNSATSPTTPSRNNYRARPPKPPGPVSVGGSTALPPLPPSPTHSYFKADELIQESSIFRDAAADRSNSYLASRSVSPLQTTPLILDSPFTRQTSIRMGHDRNRYSIRMPADDVAGVVGLGVTGADSSPHSSPSAYSTPSPSSLSFSSAFWRRRSFNDSLEKSWQAFKRESVLSEHSIQSAASSNHSQPPSGDHNGSGSGGGSGSGSNNSHRPSSVRLTSFEFLIPFFSRENSHAGSLKSFSSRKSRATGSAIAVNTAGLLSTSSGSAATSPVSLSPSLSRPQMLMMDKANRRHSSPLLTSTEEKMLVEALAISASPQHSPRQEGSDQPSPSSSSARRNSILSRMPIVDENSLLSAAVAQRRLQDQQEVDSKRPELPSATSSSLFTYYSAQTKGIHPLAPATATSEVDSSQPKMLHIEKRPRLIQQTSFQQDSAGRTLLSKGKEVVSSQQGKGDSSAPAESKRPVSGSRFSDMKKAWEILSVDVKRLNQYSHLRAYAKTYNPQTNQWAHSQPPSAAKSTTSPQVLNFGENGVDVLVMEIVNGEHLQVVAGLLEKLIERLADENVQDGEYVSCFVLSHAFFIDSEDLLARLMARFHIQPRQGEILYFEKWQTVIQVKILCVLQRWVQIQYEDFELNQSLLKTLKSFLEFDVRAAGFRLEAEFIEQNLFARSLSPIKNCSVIMEQGLFCLQRSRTRKLSLTRAQNRSGSGGPLGQPSPTFPLETFSPAPTEQMIEYGPTPELEADSPIRELDAQDLARYLTLADMKAFRSITVFELMTGWWKRRRAQESKKEAAEKRDSKSPKTVLMNVDADGDGTIEAFTRRANMLSYWVAHEIVSCKQPKHRKQLIRKFIEVAMKCRELNNLHTTMFIVSALSSTPVTRLYKTWKLVSLRDKETLKGLEMLLDPSSNMRHYRQAIAEATAPTIPFLPILLKDITFILDGNPTMIASQASVNSTPSPSAARGASSNPVASTATPGSGSSSKSGGAMLVNFDKFRRLTQYVEHAVDMAKSVDYWFEPQLLRQARVFRPSSPSNDNESHHGSLHAPSPRPRRNSNTGLGGTISGLASNASTQNNNSRGALDYISEIVERRLVKASGLYGAQQRVVEVEFSTRPKPPTSLWKASMAGMTASVGGGSSSTQGTGGAGGGYGLGGLGGSGGGSLHGAGQQETVIRAVQGEEEYLMGLSLLCESH